MITYIVFVTFKIPGVSGSHYNVRYVDSQWASKQHARDRKAELDGSLKMGKATDYILEIIEGRIADASVTDQPQENKDGPE